MPPRKPVVTDKADSPLMNVPVTKPLTIGAQEGSATDGNVSPVKKAGSPEAQKPVVTDVPKQESIETSSPVKKPGVKEVPPAVVSQPVTESKPVSKPAYEPPVDEEKPKRTFIKNSGTPAPSKPEVKNPEPVIKSPLPSRPEPVIKAPAPVRSEPARSQPAIKISTPSQPATPVTKPAPVVPKASTPARVGRG